MQPRYFRLLASAVAACCLAMMAGPAANAGIAPTNAGLTSRSTAGIERLHVRLSDPNPPIPLSIQIRSRLTDRCLAADYANVYTYSPCTVANQTWVSNPWTWTTVRFQNSATRLCLANRDYFTLRMVSCTLDDEGANWTNEFTDGTYKRIRNVHTGRYLATDYSNAAYLAPFTDNQQWYAAAATKP